MPKENCKQKTWSNLGNDAFCFLTIRTEFLLEKKKAIELASQKWKMDKETALNALQSKYEYELANIAQAERTKVLKEQAEEMESNRYEVIE